MNLGNRLVKIIKMTKSIRTKMILTVAAWPCQWNFRRLKSDGFNKVNVGIPDNSEAMTRINMRRGS